VATPEEPFPVEATGFGSLILVLSSLSPWGILPEAPSGFYIGENLVLLLGVRPKIG
jgi:hypothetical protein